MDSVQYAGDMTYQALQDYPVGGIVFAKDNIDSSSQFGTMTDNLQSYSEDISGLPLFLQQPKRVEAHLFSAIMTIWMNTTRTATVMTTVTIRHHQQIRYIAVQRPCLKSDARMTVPMPMKQASPSAV